MLIFIGLKMLGEHWIDEWIEKDVQVFISLGVILACVSGSIFYSIFIQKKAYHRTRIADHLLFHLLK